MYKSTQLLASAAIALAAMPAGAVNLVTNGDFSAGNSGFTSTYDTVSNPNQGSIYITTNPGALCGCFVWIGDHTTGTGNMLLIDGADINTGAFWSQTFNVAANSSYNFSVWASNAGTAGPIPSIRAMANSDTLVATTGLGYSTGQTATTWLQFTGTFNSGAATSVTLSLFDDNGEYYYNDMVVDDISFDGPAALAPVPEPASWAMLIAGLGLVGATMRRRATAVRFA